MLWSSPRLDLKWRQRVRRWPVPQPTWLTCKVCPIRSKWRLPACKLKRPKRTGVRRRSRPGAGAKGGGFVTITFGLAPPLPVVPGIPPVPDEPAPPDPPVPVEAAPPVPLPEVDPPVPPPELDPPLPGPAEPPLPTELPVPPDIEPSPTCAVHPVHPAATRKRHKLAQPFENTVEEGSSYEVEFFIVVSGAISTWKSAHVKRLA